MSFFLRRLKLRYAFLQNSNSAFEVIYCTARRVKFLGRIEEVDASAQGLVHDREAAFLVGQFAEVHGAQRETADFQAGPAQMRTFRDSLQGSATPVSS